MSDTTITPKLDDFENFNPDPVAIAQGIENDREPEIKKPRKAYTKRADRKDASSNEKSPNSDRLERLSVSTIGKILNAPLAITGLFVDDGEVLSLSNEMQTDLGTYGNVVLKEFFPISKDQEKWYALAIFGSLYLAGITESFTQWKKIQVEKSRTLKNDKK